MIEDLSRKFDVLKIEIMKVLQRLEDEMDKKASFKDLSNIKGIIN
jgi:hypothetical protein